MKTPPEKFSKDFYIDFPQEDACFRWDSKDRKVFCKFYGKKEYELSHKSDFFCEARMLGTEVTADQYKDK